MCCKRTAKGMRRNMFYPGPCAYVRDEVLNHYLRKRLASFRQGKIASCHQSLVFLFGLLVAHTGCRAKYLGFHHSFEVALAGIAPFRLPFPLIRREMPLLCSIVRFEHVPAVPTPDISAERSCGTFSEQHHPDFTQLSTNPRLPRGKVNMLNLNVPSFVQSASGRVKKFDQRPFTRRLCHRYQPSNLCLSKSVSPTVPRHPQPNKARCHIIDHAAEIQEVVKLPQYSKIAISCTQSCAIFRRLREKKSNVGVICARKRSFPNKIDV